MKPERISGCPLKFVCSKKWADLSIEEDDPRRRLCTECKKPVYLCQDEAEFAKRRRAGECVAIMLETTPEKVSQSEERRHDSDEGDHLTLGVPDIFGEIDLDEPDKSVELKPEPYTLKEWQESILRRESATTFHDHHFTFSHAFRIAPVLKEMLDGFGNQGLKAVFAIRNGTVEGIWFDDFNEFYYAIDISTCDPKEFLTTLSL